MAITDPIDALFLRQLCATAKGRAHLYTQLAEAEGGSGGEMMLFDHLLEYTGDDEEIAKLVRVHYADEQRHERLYVELAERTGVPVAPLPRELKVLHAIDDELGIFNKPVTCRDDVMEVYLLLLVVEERAMKQFSMLATAVEPHDPEGARIIREIEADEERHLRYCHAISKRYAPNEAVRERRLRELRKVEGRAFAKVALANLRFHLEQDTIPSPTWRVLWRGLGAIGRRRLQRMQPEFA